MLWRRFSLLGPMKLATVYTLFSHCHKFHVICCSLCILLTHVLDNSVNNEFGVTALCGSRASELCERQWEKGHSKVFHMITLYIGSILYLAYTIVSILLLKDGWHLWHYHYRYEIRYKINAFVRVTIPYTLLCVSCTLHVCDTDIKVSNSDF